MKSVLSFLCQSAHISKITKYNIELLEYLFLTRSGNVEMVVKTANVPVTNSILFA